MSAVELAEDKKLHLISKIKEYLAREHDLELGGFEAEALFEMIAEEIGPPIYNQALTDAQAILNDRLEMIQESIDLLAKPVT